jgi:hypothetical protein
MGEFGLSLVIKSQGYRVLSIESFSWEISGLTGNFSSQMAVNFGSAFALIQGVTHFFAPHRILAHNS